MTEQHETEPAAAGTGPGGARHADRLRSIQPCNFRSAGRLSNENARTLTALHEQFARNVSNALDAYLGTAVEMKLLSLEQIDFEAFIAGLPPTAHIVPCSLSPLQGTFLMEMDIALMYPIIDLLLGGLGQPVEQAHELTEIDEAIMQSVTLLIARELERSWQPLRLSLSPGHTIKHAVAMQLYPASDKPLLLTLEMKVVGITGMLRLVCPTSFASIMIRQ